MSNSETSLFDPQEPGRLAALYGMEGYRFEITLLRPSAPPHFIPR